MTSTRHIPVLQTSRLTLRKPTAADYPGYAALFATDRADHIGGQSTGVRNWLIFAGEIGHWDIHGFGMFAVVLKKTGACVGLVGPFFPPQWPEREIGWLLWPEAEGKGIAREAASAILGHLFNDLGWETVVSYIHPENTRSIALATRLGATRDDTAGRPKPEDLVYRHDPAHWRAAA